MTELVYRQVVNTDLARWSDAWWYLATDRWQANCDIKDVDLELEIERVARLLSRVLDNMSRGFAERFQLLETLQARYHRLVQQWEALPYPDHG
jgi:hypothetical protein